MIISKLEQLLCDVIQTIEDETPADEGRTKIALIYEVEEGNDRFIKAARLLEECSGFELLVLYHESMVDGDHVECPKDRILLELTPIKAAKNLSGLD